MARVVVIGGGWSGSAAALAAAQAGAEVILLERADMLLGTGLVGGIMRNNGRYTAAEEMIAMGSGTFFEITDSLSLHQNLDFPHHRHSSLYDVTRIEPAVRHALKEAGVDVRLQSRITAVQMEGQTILAVSPYGSEVISGDAFVDATGSAGPPGGCERYGHGCMMCVLRCHTFGGRVGVAALAGVREMVATTATGKVGAYSGSCELAKESIDPAIIEELERNGLVVVPLPQDLQDANKLTLKACQRYAEPEYGENLVILNTGHPKLMVPYMDLNRLRAVPGFEAARYIDPYSGGVANSVRFLGIAPRDNTLKVQGINNLYACGEKAGPLVGHTEAIVTGVLAGHNATRISMGYAPITIPTNLAIGDAISWTAERMLVPAGLGNKYTFSGSVYFHRMREKGLYTIDHEAIRMRVETSGMTGIFGRRLSEARHAI